jgi:hypothetical protein
MTHELKLQAGGTLNPGRHLYITRPEDDRLLELLLASEYVNVLTSRQMGKSSMMMYASARLAEQGVRFVSIDLRRRDGHSRQLGSLLCRTLEPHCPRSSPHDRPHGVVAGARRRDA